MPEDRVASKAFGWNAVSRNAMSVTRAIADQRRDARRSLAALQIFVRASVSIIFDRCCHIHFDDGAGIIHESMLMARNLETANRKCVGINNGASITSTIMTGNRSVPMRIIQKDAEKGH